MGNKLIMINMEVVNIKLIKRTNYLKQLDNVKGTPDIKVITDIRRSGKSKLLGSFINRIIENDTKANVIHINFNNCKYEHLLEYHSLLKYVEGKYKQGQNNYLFIDEVQMCEGFEKTINSLHPSEKMKKQKKENCFLCKKLKIHILK